MAYDSHMTYDPTLPTCDDGEGDAIPTYCGEDLPPHFTAAQLATWCDVVADTYGQGFRDGRVGHTLGQGPHAFSHGAQSYPDAYRLGHRNGVTALLSAVLPTT